MGWIADLKNLSTTTKAIIITLTLTFPFWFIFLYLYYPQIASYSWFVILLFCIPPALVWYGLFIGQYMIITKVATGSYSDSASKTFWIYAGIETLAYFIAIVVICILLHARFLTVVISLYAFKIITVIVTKPLYSTLERLKGNP